MTEIIIFFIDLKVQVSGNSLITVPNAISCWVSNSLLSFCVSHVIKKMAVV